MLIRACRSLKKHNLKSFEWRQLVWVNRIQIWNISRSMSHYLYQKSRQSLIPTNHYRPLSIFSDALQKEIISTVVKTAHTCNLLQNKTGSGWKMFSLLSSFLSARRYCASYEGEKSSGILPHCGKHKLKVMPQLLPTGAVIS